MRSEVKINWTQNFEVIMGREKKFDLYMDGNKKKLSMILPSE